MVHQGGDMTTMHRFITLSLAAATGLAAPVGAQRSVLQPGATIRFHRAGSSAQEQATIARTSGDTLWFGGCGGGCLPAVPMPNLESAERYVAVRPSSGRRVAGVAVGVAAAGLTFVVGGLACWSGNCSDRAFNIGVPIVGVASFVGGYLLVTRRHGWQVVDLTRD